MVLVYTHKITPRLRYIFKHIFTRILDLEVDFTDKVQSFVAHNGPKLSYTKNALGTEFFIRSSDLLFEQGITDIDINIAGWDDLPCFFYVGGKSAIPFDIFAASFYLITRYEEYQPHVKDIHGRFTAKQSIAYKARFLEKPLIDIWAYKFLKILQSKFNKIELPDRNFTFLSTIDIDNVFAYKQKSIIRSIAGFTHDLFRLKFKPFFYRALVLSKILKDPYDTFQELLRLKKKYNIESLFFFLVGNYTTYDTNISTSKAKFRLLIKHIADFSRVGLHPSYFTMDDIDLLKKEKERLELITNIPVSCSRQHYLRLSLPETYQNLIDLEIYEDYSMGYASHVGFRASTCIPFYFYDLEFEIQTPLKVYPFALMDTTLNDYMKLTPKQSVGKVGELLQQVKSVGGTFITLFHNESLSNYGRWRGWSRLYEAMLKKVTQ